MKNILIILLLFSLRGFSQYSVRNVTNGDTLWTKDAHPDSLFKSHLGVWTFYYKSSTINYFPFGRLVGKPTTLAGYGIADAASASDLSGYSTTSHTHSFASLTSKPTTLNGYGITDGVANTITVNGHALSGNVSVTTTDLSLNNVTNTSDASKPVSTAQQTALDLKANIASPTFTGTVGGITASMVGLGNVTNESKATMHTNPTFTGTFTAAAGSIANAALANAAVANLSGTNTGDNAVNSNYSSLVSNATHTGDATGSTALTVVKINGTSLAGLGTGILKNTTGTGVPSIAVAGDFPTLNQNTSGTAAGLSAVLSYANGGISASAATSATTGTMTVSMTSSVVTITPTGACTFNASGGVAGQILTFSITTSGTSSFVLTFGTNFRKTGTLATGTTSARFFTVTFICLDGTTWTEIARTAVQT